METIYKRVYSNLRKQIQGGVYKEGELLPSENELSQLHQITRSTVRRALNQLETDGYIIKRQGKGSIVKANRRSLGILSIRGLSEIAGYTNMKASSKTLSSPRLQTWPKDFFHPLAEEEKTAGCIFLSRLRLVEQDPIMLEFTYVPNLNLPRLSSTKFINQSLFETLNKKYQIDITGAQQDIKAVLPTDQQGELLEIDPGHPVINVNVRYKTSREGLFIYSTLFCNTTKYSIGNNIY